MNNNDKKKTHRNSDSCRGGGREEEFCGNPNSRRGCLPDCISLLFNVLSLGRTGFKIWTLLELTLLLQTDWNCDFREERGVSRTGQGAVGEMIG